MTSCCNLIYDSVLIVFNKGASTTVAVRSGSQMNVDVMRGYSFFKSLLVCFKSPAVVYVVI